MKWSALFIAVGLFSACDFLPGGGGGTGGGGGSSGSFTKGFAFVRKDDKNLYVADQSDLNSATKVTTGGGARTPSLSKDGRKIVFTRLVGTETEIATVAVGGGMVSRVLGSSATPNASNLRNPVFTPDGTRIVFAYDDGAASSIGVVSSDGSGFQRLAGGSSMSYGAPGMFPDGSAVLAAAGNNPSALDQLEKVALGTGMSTTVRNGLGSEATTVSTRVAVSPDGTKAAFDARTTGGGTPRIFVIDLATKTVTQVTDYPGDTGATDSAPCWQGNDKVCFSSDTGGNDQVYALPASSMKTSGGLQLVGATDPWYGPN